jgi:hypothetical protein
MALSTTRKGNLTIAQYVGKLTSLADEMAKRLDDEDLVGYNLASLDSDFDGVISTVATCVEPIFVSEWYGQLVSHEQHQELRGREYPMANSATRGRSGFLGCGGFGQGPPTGRGRGHGRNYNSNGGERPECQLCGRKGHTVLKCYKRFDRNYTGEDKSVSLAVASSYEVDTN